MPCRKGSGITLGVAFAFSALAALGLAGSSRAFAEQPNAGPEKTADYGIAKANVGLFDWPQWGGSPLRNNTPRGKNIPADWSVPANGQPAASKNIKWSAKLGSVTYSSPVVANGKVFIGTNNAAGYLERFPPAVDLGCLLAFDEATGKFLWQHSNRKLESGRAYDWPMNGVVSTPLVDGDRLWYVSNRGEVVCLDTEGFHDGENDGPFRDEEVADGAEADVVWKFDMMAQLGSRQHEICDCSPTSAGNILFAATSNGVDQGHINLPAPKAASFFALDRGTAKLLWTDNSPGKNILHGQWTSPTYAVLGGRPQVLFGGGDGWLYSFDPTGDGAGKSVLLWKFDCNPKDFDWVLARRAGRRCSRITLPVVYDQKVYVAIGEDPEHGAGEGVLWCIDPTKKLDGSDVSPTLVFDPLGKRAPPRREGADPAKGDIIKPNPDSAAVWCHRGFDWDGDGRLSPEEQMHRTCGGAAIQDDLLYITDLSGYAHCLNAQTGKPHWMHDLLAATLGSGPLVVDEKVYFADDDGDIAIFRHSPKKELIREINLNDTIYSTPVVANDVLYVATRHALFAIAQDAAAPETPNARSPRDGP